MDTALTVSSATRSRGAVGRVPAFLEVLEQRLAEVAHDLLSRETARAMTERGPKAKLVELPGIGHAPTLMHDDQIAIVAEFLHA